MLNVARTGMSDAHLRADLKAQNPLYEMAGSVSARFETERCPYHAMSTREFEKSEQSRRWDAILREEKHIVQPPPTWMRFRVDEYARMSAPRPAPVLRPSLTLAYASDAMAFRRYQSRLHSAVMCANSKTKERQLEANANDVREQFNAPRREAHKRNRKRSRHRGR